jgi:hypothetical protein
METPKLNFLITFSFSKCLLIYFYWKQNKYDNQETVTQNIFWSKHMLLGPTYLKHKTYFGQNIYVGVNVLMQKTSLFC